MAKHEVIVVTCDKCGYEDRDLTKFFHVTVSPLQPGKRAKAELIHGKALSSRDLCESCVGLPGVNRDK